MMFMLIKCHEIMMMLMIKENIMMLMKQVDGGEICDYVPTCA